METNRFRSTVKWLDYFEGSIAIECPNCHKKAELERQLRKEWKYRDSYKFKCNHCYVEVKEVQKYIYTVKRYCPYCSEKIEYRSMPTTKVKKEETVICKGCKTAINYEPKVETIYEWICKGKEINFTYWYFQIYQGERFWALNEEHLQYLEDFIVAKLRLRSENSWGMMLVDKLPKFIKDKNNREGLLKLISKLKEK